MDDDGIEELARAIYERVQEGRYHPAWSRLPDNRRELYRRAAVEAEELVLTKLGVRRTASAAQ